MPHYRVTRTGDNRTCLHSCTDEAAALHWALGRAVLRNHGTEVWSVTDDGTPQALLASFTASGVRRG